MIEGFKINTTKYSKVDNFSFNRIVIFEKFFKLDSVHTKLIHYSKTILKPGEFVWVIDENSLVIERHVINVVPPLTARSVVSGAYIFFNDKPSERHTSSLTLTYYVERINTLIPVHFSSKYIKGPKLICSSETNVLITLKNYIPELIKKIQEDLSFNNTSKNKTINKEARLKKLQKLHKKIVEYLRNN